MKIEDYNEYYIQGTDHYLISKDNFEELFNEMVNWKEESQNLKKQVKIKEDGFKASTEELCEYAEENQELKKQFEVGEEQYNDLVEEKEKLQEQLSSKTLQLETQQKEFIEYLKEQINECKLSGNDEDYVRADVYEEILNKIEKSDK